ncbi:MAG: chalcone isomerase family protein [Mariprofundus sp.]
MKYCMMIVLLLLASPAWARDVEGVGLPDSVAVEGQNLILNGAGVRTKFFFDIYVGALYLRSPVTSTEQVMAAPLPKRVTMNILYSEVDREKLVDGWTEGFKKNLSAGAFAELESRLNQFNALFSDARKGDQLLFDFLTDGSTRVVIQSKEAGRIAGADFQQALLKVWLGKKPADSGLKKSLLHGAH